MALASRVNGVEMATDIIAAKIKGKSVNKSDFLDMRTKHTITRFKDADDKSVAYTKGSDDRLANFRTNAVKNRMTEFQVWNIYAGKHLDAIQAYLTDGTEGPEGVISNIHDYQNYMDLLIAMILDFKGEKHE